MKIRLIVEVVAIAGVPHPLEHVEVEVQGAEVGRQVDLICIPLACLTHS